MSANTTFPALLETFFTQWLIQQKQASSHTLSSYRDTFCLLLRYGQQQLHKEPMKVTFNDLNASMIIEFLEYLQKVRGTSARSCNVRLAAIHSFFQYAALKVPEYSGIIEQVLAIPSMRYDRNPIEFLTHVECEALLGATNLKTWGGRRDNTLLRLAIQTGLRVSELTGLCWQNVTFGIGAHIRCKGKGRKTRCTPLHKDTVTALKLWKKEQQPSADAPVFPNARGSALSSDGVSYLLDIHVKNASQHCPTLQHKRITPHSLRHTAAMELLQSGVDSAVIALWLGHESTETTQVYFHANLELKEKALDKTEPMKGKIGRYQPNDKLLSFLKGL